MSKMYPTQHILIGFFASLILILIFPQISLIGFSIIWISSFMIDIDHYIYFVFKKRSLNPLEAHRYLSEKLKGFLELNKKDRKKVFGGIFFLHGIEIILILILLSKLHLYFGFVAIGFTIHLFLDILYGMKVFDRVDRVSLIYDFIKIRKLNL